MKLDIQQHANRTRNSSRISEDILNISISSTKVPDTFDVVLHVSFDVGVSDK